MSKRKIATHWVRSITSGRQANRVVSRVEVGVQRRPSFGHPFLRKFDSEEEPAPAGKECCESYPHTPYPPRSCSWRSKRVQTINKGQPSPYAGVKSVNDVYQLDRTPAALRAKSVRDPQLG
jgi:hypothetical protein